MKKITLLLTLVFALFAGSAFAVTIGVNDFKSNNNLHGYGFGYEAAFTDGDRTGSIWLTSTYKAYPGSTTRWSDYDDFMGIAVGSKGGSATIHFSSAVILNSIKMEAGNGNAFIFTFDDNSTVVYNIGNIGYAKTVDFDYDKAITSITIVRADGYKYTPGYINIYDFDVNLAPTAAAPVPAAIWLLGSGLVGLVGARSRFKK